MCDTGLVTTERWTPERRKQRTHDALLDAAITVFARRGFHGASLDEIAETAGYTRGAIYKHFPDKEALLYAACGRLNDRVIDEFAQLPNIGRPIATTDVAEVAEQWNEVMSRDSELVAVMLEFELYAIRNPAVRERAAEFRRNNRDRIVAFMEQHIATTGEQVPLPVVDLASIFGITSDAFSQAALVDKDAPRLYEQFLAVFVRGLRALTDEDAGT
jgi:AcrR family transcriptional regulator